MVPDCASHRRKRKSCGTLGKQTAGRIDKERGIMHYLLFYDVVADYPERRGAFRSEHLAYAQQAVQRGELVLGGALADPIDGAVLLFRGSSPAVAEAFAQADPYVRNGLVTQWRVRAWTTVVSESAAMRNPATRADD
jgi:uncharacterized protein